MSFDVLGNAHAAKLDESSDRDETNDIAHEVRGVGTGSMWLAMARVRKRHARAAHHQCQGDEFESQT